MPQNMEIKIVRWSGSSANQGLNLGAGMQQRFQRQPQTTLWRGPGLSWRMLMSAKTIQETQRNKSVGLRCGMRTRSSLHLNSNVLCSTLLNTTSVESVWPSLMCGHDLGQQLPSLVLCLFQRKHRLLGWSSGRSGMVGSARISRRDPCLTDCHCQFCRAFNGMLY